MHYWWLDDVEKMISPTHSVDMSACKERRPSWKSNVPLSEGLADPVDTSGLVVWVIWWQLGLVPPSQELTRHYHSLVVTDPDYRMRRINKLHEVSYYSKPVCDALPRGN
jgi:hypothetical protein